MNKLFNENQKLVTFVLKKYLCKLSDRFIRQYIEDLRQVALIGLWKACMRFDSSKGFTFSTYAVRIIQGELSIYVETITRSRRKGGTQKIISLETPTDDGLTVGDLLPAPEKEDITWILDDKRLTERQRTIARMKYEGYSQAEIGEKMGLRQTTISREIKRIADKLRDDYEIN